MQIKSNVVLKSPELKDNYTIKMSSLIFSVKTRQPEEYLLIELETPLNLLKPTPHINLPTLGRYLSAEQLDAYIARLLSPETLTPTTLTDYDFNMIVSIEADLNNGRLRVLTEYLTDQIFTLESYQIDATHTNLHRGFTL